MKKHSRKELSLPILILISTVVFISAGALCTLIFALISSLTDDPGALTGIFSLLSLLLSGSVASFVIAKLIRDGGTLIAIISSALTSLILTALGLIISGGAVHFGVFLNYAALIGISAIATLIAKKTNGKRRRYR
jgi:hypothetical protein